MGYRGRASFLRGFFWAISNTLRKGRQEFLENKPGFELTLSEQQNRFSDYCKNRWSLVKQRMPQVDDNQRAVDEGWRAGKEVEINQPLAGASAPALLEG
jgi:hypothetical protein